MLCSARNPTLAVFACVVTLVSCGDNPTGSEEETGLFNIVGSWDTSLAIGFAEEGSGSTATLDCTGIGTTVVTEDNSPNPQANHTTQTNIRLPGCGTAENGWVAAIEAPKGPTSTLPRVVYGLAQLNPAGSFDLVLDQVMRELPLGSGWQIGGNVSVSGRMERSGLTYVAVGATVTLSRLRQ